MHNIDKKIEEIDISLFSHIESQSTINDKKSILSLHAATRNIFKNFNYIEIGSHLGGSLQSFVCDSRCTSITSIDPRPLAFNDQRGITSKYPKNSTHHMLDLLKQIPGSDVSKLETIDKSTQDIADYEIDKKFHLCFIDGEHTDHACYRDALFCLKNLEVNGSIAFHDANVVYRGISNFIEFLIHKNIPFKANILPDSVFAVSIGSKSVFDDSRLIKVVGNNWVPYIYGLEQNEWYRAVLNKPFFKILRRLKFIRRIFVVKNLKAQPI
jgi:hypothetical protein